MDFERKVAVQNLEVDRLAVDIDAVLTKHVVTPEKKLASSIKYVRKAWYCRNNLNGWGLCISQ